MRKKILYITTLLPFPPDMGGKIKTLSTLKKLSQGNDVYLFSFVDKPEDLHHEKQLYKIGIQKCFTFVHPVIAERHRIIQLCLLFQSFFTAKPYSVFKYYSKEMVQSLQRFIAENGVDVFWIDHTIQTQYLSSDFKGEKVLETHNFKTDFFRDMFFAEKKVFWKLFSLYDWMKFRFYEPRQLRKFDLVYAISDKEKGKIAQFNKNVKVLIPEIPPTGNKANLKAKKLFFVGLLTWYPNKQGISWFIKEVFPRLKQEIPEITLDIVGDYSPRWNLPVHKGVRFHGYQKDLRPFWKNASVFIVPLWYGSGIRIKILEALANGIPVVSTEKGAEGLPDKIKKKIIIVNTSQEFQMAIRKVAF